MYTTTLTPEEQAAQDKATIKAAGKIILIKVAVGTALVLGVRMLVNKLDN